MDKPEKQADEWQPNLDLPDGDFLQQLGDRADRWGKAFCAIMKRKGVTIDEGLMVGWFANAIEHSNDVRRRSGSSDQR